MSVKKPIRIGLIDDHLLFREGLRDILCSQTDFQVVGEGGSGTEAISLAAQTELDVLIMDLRLPKMGGVMAIKRIRDTHKKLKIVVVTMCEDEEHHTAAIVSGADAYLSKMEESKVLMGVIRRLMRGEIIIPDETRRGLEKKTGGENGYALHESLLTPTEYRLLESLCLGKSNKDLSSEFHMSERTVKNYLNDIFKKMGVRSRLEAALEAVKRKVVSFPS